jgi:hypothetical protein
MPAPTRVGFRPPLLSVLPVAAVLTLAAVVLGSQGAVAFAMLFVGLFAVLRLRQLTVLGEDHLQVTVLRTRRIPWAEVEDFQRASGLRGGTRIETAQGVVHAVAPCSWWGGPAEEADIETLRRVRASRLRRR